MNNTVKRKLPTHIARKYILNMYAELGRTRNMLTDENNRQFDPEILKQCDKMALILGLFEEQVGKYEYFTSDPDSHYEESML